MREMKKKDLLILFLVMSVAAISRIWLPWNNFSPIGAMALIGGAYIGRNVLAFVLPLLSLFIGDLILTQVSPIHSEYLFSTTFLTVYVAFALIVVLGMLISKAKSTGNIIGYSLMASVAFFLITNFGSWLYFGMYPMNAAGLMESYVAGIPFFQNTLVSQLVFTLIFHFTMQWSISRKPALA